MAGIPFVTPIDPLEYATLQRVSPRIERVIARNPNHFTFTGTGTYVVGSSDGRSRDVAVIDPGPDLPEHRQALASVLGDRRVTSIVVTHCHSDHVGLVAWLKDLTGAPTVAWKPHGATGVLDNDADIEVMKQLAPPPRLRPRRVGSAAVRTRSTCPLAHAPCRSWAGQATAVCTRGQLSCRASNSRHKALLARTQRRT